MFHTDKYFTINHKRSDIISCDLVGKEKKSEKKPHDIYECKPGRR